MVDLSVAIVNYNTSNLLDACLKSIFEHTKGINYEVFVVDNNSSDGAIEMVKERYPQVAFIENPTNLGFARANNQAIARSKGRYILLLNPDTVVLPNTLDRMVEFMDNHPDAGIGGSRMVGPDGVLQYSCRGFPSFRTALFNRYSLLSRVFPQNRLSQKYLLTDWDHREVREVDWVSGSCLIARRAAIDEIGRLDEGFFMYAEDVDWCYRARQSDWKVYFIPQAEVVHHIAQSSKWLPTRTIVERHRSMYWFYKKHYSKSFLLDWVTAAAIMIRGGFLLGLVFWRRLWR